MNEELSDHGNPSDPAPSMDAGNSQLPDLAAVPGLLVSNLIARQAPEFAVGQVWQLVGTRSAELVVLTKVAEGGAFVVPLTSDPPDVTDPYTVQVVLTRSGVELSAWFSLETFVFTEVFSTHLDDIDTAVITAGRTAWREGVPASGDLVVGPSTEGRPETIAYREQLQQRITALAFDVNDEEPDEEAPPALMNEPMVTASPAVLLREAASKMRELAQAATPGPWIGHRIGLMGGRIGVVVAQPPPHGAFVMVDRDNEARTEDAAHIAAWHPEVALAVADWLDEVVALIEFGSELNRAGEVGAALGVARVFLGIDR